MARRYRVPTSPLNHPLLKMAAIAGAVWLGRELYGRMREQEIAGQVALVTGGTRGLGLLIARDLVANGCRVAICARSQDELDRAAQDLEQLGGDILPLRCDVSDRDEVSAMIEQATQHFGRVDILVNNAGIIEVGPITSMSRADFEHALHVMYWGILNPILSVLPQMRRRHDGKIVNITSIGGKVAVPHLLPYVGAKFAAVGLSEGLSAELRSEGITVTTIVPGLMRTGSYLHAQFKGRQQHEAAWFSLSDNIPGIAMSAERAAEQIVRAIKRGETEVVLSMPAKMVALFHGMFPVATNWILAAVNRLLLPAGVGGETDALTGSQVREQMGASPLSAFMNIGLKNAEKYFQLPSAPATSGVNGNGNGHK